MLRLPFVLGFTDAIAHRIDLTAEYVDPEDAAYFGGTPFVNVRTFNAPIPDYLFGPANMPLAATHFYNGDIGPPDTDHPLHEQWLSLETPAALARGENPGDRAVYFHRCLMILNLFLQALALAREDDRLRAISARELRPIVTIGALTSDMKWHYVGPMLMHPDAPSRSETTRTVQVHLERLSGAINTLLSGQPFTTSKQWAARARRREHEGDAAASVISFQVAAEMLLYDLLGMLMVDEGSTAQEIQQRRRLLGLKALLTQDLSRRLGGSWDLRNRDKEVGRYWQDLYLIRNQIAHVGYAAHDGDSERAKLAFASISEFIDERLWANRNRYPRSVLVKITRSGTVERGESSAMRKRNDVLESEPIPYYLPRDIAGRQA